jgi:hypothetical protein
MASVQRQLEAAVAEAATARIDAETERAARLQVEARAEALQVCMPCSLEPRGDTPQSHALLANGTAQGVTCHHQEPEMFTGRARARERERERENITSVHPDGVEEMVHPYVETVS